MALVYNCNDNMTATVFISGLQVSHSLHKHLVKHEDNMIRDILFRVKKYIQIEDAICSAIDRSSKGGIRRRS